MDTPLPDTEFTFIIKNEKVGKVFSFNEQLNFLRINDKGLFCVFQSKLPSDDNYKKRLDKNEIYILSLSNLIKDFKKVKQVKDYLKDKKIITYSPLPDRAWHALFADKYNDFMIAEIWKGKNEIVTNKQKFIVMTNFQNSVFKDKSYKDIINLPGGDRYITAYDYIRDNINNFNIEKAWEVLKKTKQEGSAFTICSTIFLPEENIIYVVLNREFEKIWKISIDNRTIETFKGFKTKSLIDINEKAVSSIGLLSVM